MGRALSWSLAAHAAFIISFLLLSATRQPVTIPQVARPVRLVTYLEPTAVPRQRSGPIPAVRPPAEPQVLQPQAPAIPPPAAAAASPAAAASKVAIPLEEPKPAAVVHTPAPPAGEQFGWRARAERRLARLTTTENRSDGITPPPIAGLPPAEVIAAAVPPTPSSPGTPAAQPGDVTPIGYFPFDAYISTLKMNIFDRWLPPPELIKSLEPRVALVSFRIDRAGVISGITLKKPSGSASFDRSARAMVRGLVKVSPLPEQYREETLDVVIRFQYQ